jgi:transcriptional regulator with XRE-family HTH domain
MRIRELRQIKNISRASFAQKIGVNAETLARYERGEREPIFSHALHIAEILGVPIEELVRDNLQQENSGQGQLPTLISWLTRWAPEISSQVDDGHEVADIVVDFMDPSKWNPETIKLKQYIKAGLPNLERLIELMREVPDESGAESAA